jgi:hypothetical protein
MLTRRDLFRQVTGAVAVAAAPILSGSTIATRLMVDGMSTPTWRLVQQRLAAQTFTCHSIATVRATGWIGYFVDKTGRVVGFLRVDGSLYQGSLRTLKKIGTAVPMDHRNPVNW